MSIALRKWVANHPHLFFQNPSQKADLLDEKKTQSVTIALLQDLLNKQHYIELTAVKTDHHDDSGLGLHCHFNGYCFDGWFLNTPKAGDYAAVDSAVMIAGLHDAGADDHKYQIGETPDAYTHAEIVAAGTVGVFKDGGGSHIHFGAK